MIRAGLRLLEDDENKIRALKKAIWQGIDSGTADNFNPKKHPGLLKANRKKNG